MKRKAIRKPAQIFLVCISLILGAFCWFVGSDITTRVEENTREVVEHAIPVKDMGWVSAQVDGTIVHLSGDAPDQVARVRVTEALVKKINVSRVVNDIVAPDLEVEEPKVRLEIVQNERVSSIIGLLPREPSPAALYRALDRAKPLITTLNLVEDTSADPGDAWADQLDFLGKIAGEVPNVKISATPGVVKIDALAATDEIATSLRKKLTDLAPENVNLQLNIASPRKLIAPFEFSLAKDEETVTLSKCSATDRNDLVAMRAAFRGIDTTAIDACELGLGAPTEKWGEFISEALLAVANTDRFEFNVRDNQVVLKLSDQMSEAERAAQIKQVKAVLPTGFGLETELLTTMRTIEDLKADGEAMKLTFVASEDGKFGADGVLGSTSSLENLKGFAVAKFGTENVEFNIDVVEGLPVNWEKNAFSSLQAISAMNEGEVLITSDQILFTGAVESEEIREGLEKILKEEMVEVQVSQEITVSERAVNEVAVISPAMCVDQISELLTSKPIQFEKSSTNIDAASLDDINQTAQILASCSAYRFEIGGHTDSQGGEELNRSISEKRAKAVFDAIIDTGLEFGELTFRGFGPSEPIASNDTAEGRAKNRRIEIRLISESGG